MEKTELLHTDSDGHKVLLHIERHELRAAKRWVSYQRYPNVRYDYLTALKAAEMILLGHNIAQCYVEALTVEALAEAEEKLNTGQFEPEGSIEINGKKRERPVLKQPIRCFGCLIGEVYLTRLILENDMQFHPPTPFPEQTCILREADFRFTRFGGYAYFTSATFSDATSFRSASFGGSAHFTGASFGGCADFRSASFGGAADFTRMFCSYGGFVRATFNGEARFYGATFDRYANFWQATFAGDVAFGGVTFGREAGFGKATCRGKADFRGSAMLSFNLGHARFEKLCDMTEVAAGKVNLRGTVFAESVLLSSRQCARSLQDSQKVIGESLKMRKQKVGIPQKLEQLREWRESKRGIYSVNFKETLVQGELVCHFHNLAPPIKFPTPPPEKAIIEPHRERNWDEARRQYAWLKEQFRKRGSYDDEDDAHWWASECARMQAKIYRPKFAPIILLITVLIINLWFAGAILAWGGKSPLDRFVSSVVGSSPVVAIALLAALFWALPRFGARFVKKWIFGYGVRIKNIAVTILIVILGSSVLFFFAIADNLIIKKCGDRPPFTCDYLNSLYFSVITFATVGYGDVRAVGWAAGLAMVEGLLGIALNAALVVVIFRKLIR